MKQIWLNAIILVIVAGNQALAESGNGSIKSPDNVSGPAYHINNSRSLLRWEGSKPGGKHHGTIEVINGSAYSEGRLISGGSFEIDMRTIKNEDVQNEGMQQKLVGHLKSEDFFHVESFPLASFEIKRVEAAEGSIQVITGDLTLRGKSREISFPAKVSMDEKMIHARTGDIVLDRTMWGVNHMSKSVFAEMKDRYVDDEMIVKLDLHFNRR